MNRKIERQYIRKVRQSLPVYGCKERAYIKKLEEHLQDYCDEYPGVTEEDIVKEFGTPTSVVSDYFCEIDEDYLFRKLRIRNHVRISIFVITACIIILNIFFLIIIYLQKPFETEFVDMSTYYSSESSSYSTFSGRYT